MRIVLILLLQIRVERFGVSSRHLAFGGVNLTVLIRREMQDSVLTDGAILSQCWQWLGQVLTGVLVSFHGSSRCIFWLSLLSILTFVNCDYVTFTQLGLFCPMSLYCFIPSDCFYSASSSSLLLRGAPDTARILCRNFTLKRHRQLWVKDLPKVPTWRLERESNPWPIGRKASTLPMPHTRPKHIHLIDWLE